MIDNILIGVISALLAIVASWILASRFNGFMVILCVPFMVFFCISLLQISYMYDGVFMPENAYVACITAYGDTAQPIPQPKGSPDNIVYCEVKTLKNASFDNGTFYPSKTITERFGPIKINKG